MSSPLALWPKKKKKLPNYLHVCLYIKLLIGLITEQGEVIVLGQQHARTLANENKLHLVAAQKQKSLMAKIEKDRDRNAEEAQVLADKVEQVQGTLYIY